MKWKRKTIFLIFKFLSDDYYKIKILTLKNDPANESHDDKQGKMLLHTEHSLLSLLEGEPGIPKQYGMFQVSSWPSLFCFHE